MLYIHVSYQLFTDSMDWVYVFCYLVLPQLFPDL